MAGSATNVARPELFIGLMSGTSLDGVDAVLADFASGRPSVLAHVHRPFPADLREELAALTISGTDEIERSGRAAVRLADLYAECVRGTLAAAGKSAAEIRAIGAHGQTIRHRPEAGFSAQLNAPGRLAEATGIDVVADFRNRDIAAGGQGAPLVPAFHAAAFASSTPRVVVNIGGISNITFLSADNGATLGFDCGPGNVLLDMHVARHVDEAFDRGGTFAATGQVDDALLGRLLAEPFLQLAPPKSTGRELFSAHWLNAVLGDFKLPAADIQRTLTEFTARCIADAIARWCASAQDVVVCGGGARNAVLVGALQAAVSPGVVQLSDAIGIPHDQVEALAFAWLARQCLRREPGAVAAVTGARGARVLGAIYPR
jgi:anhydro-N-acetylmuramic acid kinase